MSTPNTKRWHRIERLKDGKWEAVTLFDDRPLSDVRLALADAKEYPLIYTYRIVEVLKTVQVTETETVVT